MVKVPIHYIIKTINLETCFKAYKPMEVEGYCQNCHNYGKNHSCPEFDFRPKQLLDQYKYVSLILTEISSEPLKENWNYIKNLDWSSTVLNKYDDNQEKMLTETKVSMWIFEQMKDYMTDVLLKAELELNTTYASPPGSCTRCDICEKEIGKSCKYPDQLRYSLESLGFLVSDLYKLFFNKTLGWSEKGLQSHYHTCSALFSERKLQHSEVERFLTLETLEL